LEKEQSFSFMQRIQQLLRKHIHSLETTQNPPVDQAQRQSTPVHFITLVSLISILILSCYPRLSSRHSSYLLKIRNIHLLLQTNLGLFRPTQYGTQPSRFQR